jgi:hypothetical protein
MSKKSRAYKPNRNLYLAFLAAWRQFRSFREHCTAYNVSRPVGSPRKDPIRDFSGVDVEKIRDATHEWVTSTRRMHAREIHEGFLHLGRSRIISDRPSEGYTFGGHGEGEKFAAALNKRSEYLTNPDNRRWWPGLVVLAVMSDGISRDMALLMERSGLLRDQIALGFSQLKRGFTVKTVQSNGERFKGSMVEMKPGFYRLPDHLLFADEDTDLDDVLPDAPKPDPTLDLEAEHDHFVSQVASAFNLPKSAIDGSAKVPDPNNMHGAADGFAGTDDAGGGMHSPSAESIRQELKKVGGDKVASKPPVKPTPKGNGTRKGQVELIIRLSRDDYEMVTEYVVSQGSKGISEVMEVAFQGILVNAQKAARDKAIQDRLNEVRRLRDAKLAEIDAEIARLESALAP